MNAICRVSECFNEGLFYIRCSLSSEGCSGGCAVAQPVYCSKAGQFAFLRLNEKIYLEAAKYSSLQSFHNL